MMEVENEENSMVSENDQDEDVKISENDEEINFGSRRLLRKQSGQLKPCPKDERNATIKKVSSILQKTESERTVNDVEFLEDSKEIVDEVKNRRRKRDEAKRRLEEFEEPEGTLREKCIILAQAIAQSQHLVVYTGAGISTAARIPDYRGTNGIWTRLQQGKEIGNHDLSLAEPTFTHMALTELYKRNILKYVVSQNCDGLHLRSGIPKTAISEVHGNMYIEVCKTCKPSREYWRHFDVTENTARYSHKTMRKCYACNGSLIDTIVHFGERGSLQWPLNWSGASKNAKKATTILCLGSSLKVLKKYPWLWQMHKPVKRRPNLYIVNLQWTPKDETANAKIHGKCDSVMKIVMELLGIEVPEYVRGKDPIYAHGSSLHETEGHTTTQPLLKDIKEEVEVKIEEKSPPAISQNSFFDNLLKESAMNLVKSEGNLLLNQNCQTLLTYYQISNRILQNQMLGLDMLNYPFQTSFLYSGLHSIINPMPFLTEEHNYSNVKQVKIECRFCHENYKSTECLFYNRHEPKFLKQETRFSKLENVEKPINCLCCDYTTEEDEDDSKDNEDDTSASSPDKISKLANEQEENRKVQPGWFGKGYRKNRKYKKKVSNQY